MNDSPNIAPVMGASNIESVPSPWSGYPADALFQKARLLARWHGLSFPNALGCVVRFYDYTGRVPNVRVPASPEARALMGALFVDSDEEEVRA